MLSNSEIRCKGLNFLYTLGKRCLTFYQFCFLLIIAITTRMSCSFLRKTKNYNITNILNCNV